MTVGCVIKISQKTRDLYEQRDRSLDTSDAPCLPPEMWENPIIGKYYQPKKQMLADLRLSGERDRTPPANP